MTGRRRVAPRGPVRSTIAGLAAVMTAAHLAANAGRVWRASRRDQARPVQAIVVLGSAQHGGVPSPDLAARLSHALSLWRRGLAPLIVVTGGRGPGDTTTEAAAAAGWLADRGVPQSAILREADGRNTWGSLRAAAGFLARRGVSEVLLVSDPYHDDRVALMAATLGLEPYVSPTRVSPIRGIAAVPYFAKETAEVALGRVIGFRALGYLDSLIRGGGGVR